MRRIQGCLFLALLIFSLFSASCQGTPTPPPPPTPTPTPTPTPGPDYKRFLRGIVPEDWREVDPQEVPAGGETPVREWVVFYRAGDSSENHIDAVMYRLILEGPPTSSDKTSSFVAYDLYSPYKGHMCVCKCKASRADLLSAYGGSELVISDECQGEVSRLLAYWWVTETQKYEHLAHFDGDRIYTDLDLVVVDNYTSGMAGLVFRCTYSPREDALIFSEDDSYSKGECVFPNGLPDNVLTSPCPEVVVLALYSQYTDMTKVQGYFADGAWESMGQCRAGQCGCPVKSSPIARVRVIDMEIDESRQVVGHADRDCPPDQAIEAAADQAFVTTEAVCEYGDGSREFISATWILTWVGNGWRLVRMAALEMMGSSLP